MNSLNTRLLFAASLVLAAFLGFTGFILDHAFRDSAEAALRDRLQSNIYALLAAADLNAGGQLSLPDALPEARFSMPDSGLYAEVSHADGAQIWRSPSAIGLQIPFSTDLPAGERRYTTFTMPDGNDLSTLSFGVAWEMAAGNSQGYIFSVAENLDGLNAEVQSFRRSLWGWLVGVALVLLAVQGSILRWSLAPLRQVTADLAEIEAGRRTELIGQYPHELRGLTENLNALIRHERSHLERYRHTLDDLAHSLKTPLAVLRGTLGGGSNQEFQHNVQEQVDRMNQIVQYQLQRAATSGRTTLAAPIGLAEAVQKITASLDKVYADKNVTCNMCIDDKIFFHGDEGDLLELLGNLLDNAYKSCQQRVAISAQSLVDHSYRTGLVFYVEDDGRGIPLDMAQSVLQRGVRMDTATPGQGIGLAVVQDIVRIYNGTLEIGSSHLGGARLTVHLPAD